MYQTKIYKVLNLWVLSIESSEQVLRAFTATRYLDVLGIAHMLQLNIDVDQTKEN
jgi:hypothetical protein